MEVINNATGKDTKNVAESLAKILSEKTDTICPARPLIFIEAYFKNAKGILETHNLYCRLRLPIDIQNTFDEKNPGIYLSTISHEIYHKLDDKPWKKAEGDLELPANANLVYMDKEIEDKKQIGAATIQTLKFDNDFRLYLGAPAQERLSEEYKFLNKSSKK